MNCPFTQLRLMLMLSAIAVCHGKLSVSSKLQSEPNRSLSWIAGNGATSVPFSQKRYSPARQTNVELRGLVPWTWTNHYSTKYSLCFVFVATSSKNTVLVKLLDSFERSQLAQRGLGMPPEGFCGIGDEPVDCAKADAFIEEHMKN